VKKRLSVVLVAWALPPLHAATLVLSAGGLTVYDRKASVQFAGLVAPGQFQFNVVIPASLGNGDQTVTATYGGASTQAGTLLTIQN
jgi:uncharacterized protein (TIGR03437 family)